MISTTCMPRSPRWLVQNDNIQEARDVLCTLRSSEEVANEELQEIIEHVQAARALGEPRWTELCKGRLGGTLALGVALQLLQQLCGINAVMYFGPRIFKAVNLDPLLCQTLNAGVNLL